MRVNLHTLELDADQATVERWERFVAACPEATFFHRAAWRRVLAATFGHRPYFLYAEENGEIRGILPLARQKSLVFGDALISAPFCVYGGVAATHEPARRVLEDAAAALGEKLGVDHVEFRNLQPRRDDWERHSHNCTFRKAIDADPEKNLLAILKMAEHICASYRVLGNQTEDFEWNAVGPLVIDYVGLSEYDFETLKHTIRDLGAH